MKMNHINILDCTLRDGGYINNWQFGKENIKNIINNLEDAKIDIIECGFIRCVGQDENSSVFSSMEQVKRIIAPKKENILYAIMIEQHNRVEDLIPNNDGQGADIIRVTFRREEWEETKSTIRNLITKGYKVCVQPVGTVSYDDATLLQVIKDVNILKPYAFYLVDTLGVMYRHEMRRFFYLIDNNLSKDICLGFHSHNNLQMSFSNAQEMIRLARKRNIIIDSSCYGMGRGVGNLATELFVDYINNNIDNKYSLIPILNVVDKYLMPIYAEQRWGYDLPYFLSAIAKCHPNYAAHLIKKETIAIEKIGKLLSLIPNEERSEYNASLIEQLYLDFQKCVEDDHESLNAVRYIIADRPVLIMGSGSSIDREKEKINRIVNVERPFIITTNFITNQYPGNALFISNEKRVENIKNRIGELKYVLATSNLKSVLEENAFIFDYSTFLGEGDAADNAGAMLIRILRRISVKKIYLAGFDGFDVDVSLNYYNSTYRKSLDYNSTKKKNEDISKQLKLALSGMNYEVITKTKYEI